MIYPARLIGEATIPPSKSIGYGTAIDAALQSRPGAGPVVPTVSDAVNKTRLPDQLQYMTRLNA